MNKIKIAFILPSKSKNWQTPESSFIYKYLITTFKTSCLEDFVYKFFVGYDEDDEFYNNVNNITFLQNQNINIEFHKLNIEKGYLTKMWNVLGKIAFTENYDYIYICGDDIQFLHSNWISACIEKLVNNNIGVTGPSSENSGLLEQNFVHRTHYKIFNFIYPEDLKNWGCDNWINDIYKPKHFFTLPIEKYFIINSSPARYPIDHDWRKDYNTIIKRDKNILEKYLTTL